MGKRLYLRVNDLISKNDLPTVTSETNVKDVIIEISEKRLGATAVIDDNKIKGMITDGDIRRMLEKHHDISSLTAKDIMTANPKTLDADAMAIDALNTLEKHGITQILVVNKEAYVGIIHLHDLIKEGIF